MDLSAFFNSLGIHSEKLISIIQILAQFIIAGLIGWLTYFIIKKWLAKIFIRIASKTDNKWDDILINSKFFKNLAILITPIAIRIAASNIQWSGMEYIYRVLNAWIIVAVLMIILSILNFITQVSESNEKTRERPIRIIVQVIKILLYAMAVIAIVCTLLDKDPTKLLVGLGASTAVLMLVFQDTILGLVAGIQLSSNKMVRIGDWIQMPGAGADGDVIEIGLTTVKVQNFDRTIVTIPTRKLVSDSFTNWRGMEESGGRRIKRSINIDVSSIHYLTNDELELMKESALLKGYIERKIKELEAYNANRPTDLDARKLTNIGTFREYLEQWIANNPNIHQGMTHMVRQLQPGPTGLPIEIYCFSANQNWIAYENIQSDIFDHIYAVIGLFHLKPFQFVDGVNPRVIS